MRLVYLASFALLASTTLAQGRPIITSGARQSSDPLRQTISLEPIDCLVAGEPPLFKGDVEPRERVGLARLYFSPGHRDEYFYIEMSLEAGRFVGKLPAPSIESSPVTYYFQVTTVDFDGWQSREYEADVIADPSECEGKVAAAGPPGAVEVFSAFNEQWGDGFGDPVDPNLPPPFYWPPPKWTSSSSIPMELLTAGGEGTLDAAAESLAATLERAGLGEARTLSIEDDGFAIVAPMECIDEQGVPLAGDRRWGCSGGVKIGFSLFGLLGSINSGERGRYRVIVILVTNRFLERSAGGAASIAASRLEGYDPTPDRPFGGRPVPPDAECVALVYEFHKETEKDPAFLVPGSRSRLQAKDHLLQAGLWTKADLQDAKEH